MLSAALSTLLRRVLCVLQSAAKYGRDRSCRAAMACYANLRVVGKWRVVDSSSAQLGAECSTPSASVEPAKSISGRRIDFLGYAIDVDQQLVVIAKKNVLKALHAYFRRL